MNQINKPLAEIQKQIIPHPIQAENANCANYLDILTDQECVEELQRLAMELKANLIRQYGVEMIDRPISFFLTRIDREKALTYAATRKIRQKEIEAEIEARKREKQKTAKAIQELYTFDHFYNLIVDGIMKRKGNYISEPAGEHFLLAICYFMAYDARFETELGYSFKKGFMIQGESGVGKTAPFEILENNPRYPMIVLPVEEAVKIYRKNDNELIIPPYKALVLDDVGREKLGQKNYGSEFDFFGEYIADRYKNRDTWNMLHVTTNADGDAIQERHGYYIRRRCREMFNQIKYDGKDKSKENEK